MIQLYGVILSYNTQIPYSDMMRRRNTGYCTRRTGAPYPVMNTVP